MTPEELAAKWYAKTHKIKLLRDRIRVLEGELNIEKDDQRQFAADLVDHFATVNGDTKTHRIFLPSDDTFPAAIIEVLSNSSASGVCSYPLAAVGKHVELEDLS